jgi:hypothetical protein
MDFSGGKLKQKRFFHSVEGPLELHSSALSLIGGVHIGARALLDINLIWFGYIARISPILFDFIVVVSFPLYCFFKSTKYIFYIFMVFQGWFGAYDPQRNSGKAG